MLTASVPGVGRNVGLEIVQVCRCVLERSARRGKDPAQEVPETNGVCVGV